MAITATANPVASQALPSVLLALSAVLADLSRIIEGGSPPAALDDAVPPPPVPDPARGIPPVSYSRHGYSDDMMSSLEDLILDLLEDDPGSYVRGTDLVAACLEQGFNRTAIYDALYNLRCSPGKVQFQKVGNAHLYRAAIAKQERKNPRPCDCPENIDRGVKLTAKNWGRR